MMQPVFFVLLAGLLGGRIADIPVLGVRISLLDCSVVAVLLVALFRQKKRFIPRLWGPVLGYAFGTLLSVLVNTGTVPLVWSGVGVLYVIRFLLYAALYWVAASDTFEVGSLLTPLVWSGVGIAALGFIQLVLYPNLRNLYYLGWDPHVGRLFSTLLDPNFTGIYLALTALLLLYGWGEKKHMLSRLGFVVVSVALLFTYSRSSIAAYGAGLLVWGMLTGRKKLIGVLLILAVAGLVLLPRGSEGQNILRSTSSMARLGTAASGIEIFLARPVLGTGMNTLLMKHADTAPIPSRTGTGIDTSLIAVAAADGLLGLFFIVWFLVACVFLGKTGLAKSTRLREESALYLAALSAIFVHSLFVNSLLYPWVLVWLFVGTGVIERRIRADR